MPRVFLSYARADEDVAARVRERLACERDIEIKQDRLFLEGGVGFWKQITDAIDSVEFLILVATPAALASGMVQKEWRYARQQGVCVYPVKGAPDSALNFPKMPLWMRKKHFFDLEKEWPTFLGHLRKGCDRQRVPLMAPDLPERFVPRPNEFEALKKLLLTSDGPVAITTALTGAGGFGKTTLAAALCHDKDIIENFDDGILWVTLGRTPDVLREFITAYAAVTGERPAFSGVEDAAYHLEQKLKDRNCLVVVDDVWNADHLRPFLRGRKSAARLFTTRNAAIAADAASVDVDQMRESEAVEMLPDLEQGAAGGLAHKLGKCPIALELAASMIRERVRNGDSATHAAEVVARKGVGDGSVPRIIDASLEMFEEADRRRFRELSIFPEDVGIPLSAAGAVWGLDESDAEDLAIRLARFSLAKLDLGRGVLRLHDVMRLKVADAKEVHARLIASWTDWRKLPDEYAWRWLSWHLAQAGRAADLERILLDPVWMYAKLAATDVNALLADYEQISLSPELALVRDAVRLSGHVLAVDETQFAPQMIGRLLPHCENPVIQRFVDKVPATAPRVWLRPLWPSFHPPGAGLVWTLEAHSTGVSGLAVAPDGKRAVSASSDNTLKVWDLETGRELRTLKGHSLPVIGVAVTSNGKRAVSASFDNTLKVWELESGRELRTLKGHSQGVYGASVTPDGKQAVSASEDNTLKVWDLASGRELRTLRGHFARVSGVAVTPDGKRAVSASFDNTLKVWDLASGREQRTFEGHSGYVSGVAVTPDGKQAVSASWDHRLKVWELESGRERRTLEGHSDYVSGVAVTPDGKRAVSTSFDNTLKVWDLETGRELRTLQGHSHSVRGVAVTSNGKRAVSASDDKTIKVWDLESEGDRRRLQHHSGPISSVAVTPDGKRAVSASADKTLKVWNLESGRELRTLEGHCARVLNVAVMPDGKRAVSTSADDTLKVWNLESGRELSMLRRYDRVSTGAMAGDGKRAVYTSAGYTLKVSDLESGHELRTLKGHSAPVSGIAMAPDGKQAVSASADKTLKVWDLETGQELRTLKGHSAPVSGIAVMPNCKRAVSVSSDKTLKVWDLETGCELRALDGHSATVRSVGVTPDGKWAASVSDDKTLKMWDLESGLLVASFYADVALKCCACARTLIVAGDNNGRLHILLFQSS
jgi:WD40 repeat protein